MNTVSKTDPYPLPQIEDIFASLAGGKTFTKLDLEIAYQQVPLNEHVYNKTTNFRVGILHRSRRVQKGGGLAGNLRWVCTMAVKFKSFETHVSA